MKTHTDNQFILSAAFSSLTPKNLPAVTEAVLADAGKPPPTVVIENLLAYAVAKADATGLAKLVAAVGPKQGPFTGDQFKLLGSLLDALDRRKSSLTELAKSESPELKAAAEGLLTAFAQARQWAVDPKTPASDRLAAIRVLGRRPDDPVNDRAVLVDLLGPQSSSEIQAAAVAALARSADDDVPPTLLKQWKGFSPTVRAKVLSTLLARETWVPAVLTAIEKKEILAAEMDAAARQWLLTHPTPAVRDRAGQLLAGSVDVDRVKILNAYKPAMTKSGDRERGKAVFTKACAACHKLGDVGKGLGPDLTPSPTSRRSIS